jgi:hypothetical protein
MAAGPHCGHDYDPGSYRAGTQEGAANVLRWERAAPDAGASKEPTAVFLKDDVSASAVDSRCSQTVFFPALFQFVPTGEPFMNIPVTLSRCIV